MVKLDEELLENYSMVYALKGALESGNEKGVRIYFFGDDWETAHKPGDVSSVGSYNPVWRLAEYAEEKTISTEPQGYEDVLMLRGGLEGADDRKIHDYFAMGDAFPRKKDRVLCTVLWAQEKQLKELSELAEWAASRADYSAVVRLMDEARGVVLRNHKWSLEPSEELKGKFVEISSMVPRSIIKWADDVARMSDEGGLSSSDIHGLLTDLESRMEDYSRTARCYSWPGEVPPVDLIDEFVGYNSQSFRETLYAAGEAMTKDFSPEQALECLYEAHNKLIKEEAGLLVERIMDGIKRFSLEKRGEPGASRETGERVLEYVRQFDRLTGSDKHVEVKGHLADVEDSPRIEDPSYIQKGGVYYHRLEKELKEVVENLQYKRSG